MLYPRPAMALQERARSRRVCLGVHHSAISPQLIELYGHMGLDFVIVSAEVESVDKYLLENLLRAADAAQTTPIVKIMRRDHLLIEEAMNAGAPMVMVPHVTCRAELDQAVLASRFSPRGSRGLCPVSRYTGYGSRSLKHAVASANDGRNVIPIIEDRQALPNLEAIFASPDVDVFEFGPFDMCQSLGLDPDLGYAHPEIIEILDRVGGFARKYGKSLLAPLARPPDANTPDKVLTLQIDLLLKRGVTMFYGIEVFILARAFREWMGLRELAAD